MVGQKGRDEPEEHPRIDVAKVVLVVPSPRLRGCRRAKGRGSKKRAGSELRLKGSTNPPRQPGWRSWPGTCPAAAEGTAGAGPGGRPRSVPRGTGLPRRARTWCTPHALGERSPNSHVSSRAASTGCGPNSTSLTRGVRESPAPVLAPRPDLGQVAGPAGPEAARVDVDPELKAASHCV